MKEFTFDLQRFATWKVDSTGDTTYSSLSAAISKAIDGDTITLQGSGTESHFTIANTVADNLTIDLGGNIYTIYNSGNNGTSTRPLTVNKDITFKNGTLRKRETNLLPDKANY